MSAAALLPNCFFVWPTPRPPDGCPATFPILQLGHNDSKRYPRIVGRNRKNREGQHAHRRRWSHVEDWEGCWRLGLSYNPRNAMIKTATVLVLVAILQAAPAQDPVAVMVGRLDLEKYKTTIKGLTQFGDRRQGTDRNRAAIDWIEAQLKSYGCMNTERIQYQYTGHQIRPDGARGSNRAAVPGTVL